MKYTHHKTSLFQHTARQDTDSLPDCEADHGDVVNEQAVGCDLLEADDSFNFCSSDEPSNKCRDPLLQAALEWHRRVGTWLLIRIKRGLQQLVSSQHVLTVGTMFSGADISERLVNKLHKVWSTLLGDTVPQLFRFVFQCEIDPLKQVWLTEQFPDVPFLFSDAASLSQPKALNLKSGDYVQVPSVHVLLAGFSCKSRSKLNSNSASNKHCVREGREETGMTFEFVQNYVVLKKPTLVILENVTELQEGGPESDMQFIIDTFSAHGYHGDAFEIEARSYGSFPQRKRLYFVLCKGNSMTKIELIKGMLEARADVSDFASCFCSFVWPETQSQRHKQRDMTYASRDTCTLHALLDQEMKCDSSVLRLDDFLLDNTELRKLELPPMEAKGGKKEPSFERHHEELFLSEGWAWPLSEARFVDSCGSSMLCLSQRAREVVYVAHEKWEMPEAVEARRFELMTLCHSPA